MSPLYHDGFKVRLPPRRRLAICGDPPLIFSGPLIHIQMPMTVRRVVLVIVEGLKAEAIDRLSLFNLSRLVDRGASALNVQSEISDLPATRLASLLTGVSPMRHGVTTGGWTFGRTLSRLEPLASAIATEGFQATAFLPQLPPEHARRVGFIGRDLGFQQVTCKGSNASEVVSSALNVLCTQRRGLIAIRFSDLSGLDMLDVFSADYRSAAVRVDQSLGILSSLSGASSGDSLLVVAADQRAPAILEAPGKEPPSRNMSVVLFGRSVCRAQLDRASLLDIPSTILWALGVPVPRHYEGRALVEAFVTNSSSAEVRHTA